MNILIIKGTKFYALHCTINEKLTNKFVVPVTITLDHLERIIAFFSCKIMQPPTELVGFLVVADILQSK